MRVSSCGHCGAAAAPRSTMDSFVQATADFVDAQSVAGSRERDAACGMKKGPHPFSGVRPVSSGSAFVGIRYTPARRSSSPVLSPKRSMGAPNLSIRVSDRFASGVPFGYRR